MTITPEAKNRIQEWENSLPDSDNSVDVSSRMGIHAYRAAMARAWGATKQRTTITLEDADAAILLGQYQAKTREHYAPSAGDTVRDKHISRVENAIRQAGQINLRDLRKLVNADRFREDFDRALEWLQRQKKIVMQDAPRKQKIVAWVQGQ